MFIDINSKLCTIYTNNLKKVLKVKLKNSREKPKDSALKNKKMADNALNVCSATSGALEMFKRHHSLTIVLAR